MWNTKNLSTLHAPCVPGNALSTGNTKDSKTKSVSTFLGLVTVNRQHWLKRHRNKYKITTVIWKNNTCKYESYNQDIWTSVGDHRKFHEEVTLEPGSEIDQEWRETWRMKETSLPKEQMVQRSCVWRRAGPWHIRAPKRQPVWLQGREQEGCGVRRPERCTGPHRPILWGSGPTELPSPMPYIGQAVREVL